MSLEFETVDELLKAKTIGGLSIKILEKIARPGALAQSGFIDARERLVQDVLLPDWHTVERLGTTHIELAAQLGEIIKQSKQANLLDWRSLTHDAKALHPAALPQTLNVSEISYRGLQVGIRESRIIC